MRFLLIAFAFTLTTSAFAGISCPGAIQYAVNDIAKTQIDLIDGVLSFEDAQKALDLENGRHRDVILGCKMNGPQDRYDYCSVVPKLLIQRNGIIKKSEFTKKQKAKLSFQNSHNQELARIICP